MTLDEIVDHLCAKTNPKTPPTTEKDVAALLFGYFRFKRKMHCVTQISVFYKDIEDFIAFDKRKIYCVEIKVDKQDFLNDFKTKEKHKGFMYYDKFYFCVPVHLVDFAKEFLKDYPHYGLFAAYDKNIQSIVRAKGCRRKHGFIRGDTYDLLVSRMSSELAREKNNLKPKKERK